MKVWHGDIVVLVSRTRERCDQLASKGFMVILPDYYHGAEAQKCSPTDFFCWMGQFIISQKSSTISFLTGLKPFTVANSNWTQLQSDWNLVRSWAEEKGVTRFAAVGITLKACSVKSTMCFIPRNMLGFLHDFEDVFLA